MGLGLNPSAVTTFSLDLPLRTWPKKHTTITRVICWLLSRPGFLIICDSILYALRTVLSPSLEVTYSPSFRYTIHRYSIVFETVTISALERVVEWPMLSFPSSGCCRWAKMHSPNDQWGLRKGGRQSTPHIQHRHHSGRCRDLVPVSHAVYHSSDSAVRVQLLEMDREKLH